MDVLWLMFEVEVEVEEEVRSMLDVEEEESSVLVVISSLGLYTPSKKTH